MASKHPSIINPETSILSIIQSAGSFAIQSSCQEVIFANQNNPEMTENHFPAAAFVRFMNRYSTVQSV